MIMKNIIIIVAISIINDHLLAVGFLWSSAGLSFCARTTGQAAQLQVPDNHHDDDDDEDENDDDDDDDDDDYDHYQVGPCKSQ